jgi:KDO2-lipid IV(A) lauroyltransferase
MTRWYQHRYHTPFSHKLVFTLIPRVPKFLQPLIALITALLFFFLLGRERRALVSNLKRICGGGNFTLLWKAYWVFYSFCDFMVSYCYVPRASHAQLPAMLAVEDRGMEVVDRCLNEGNGVIVWTAHLGNWEFASRLLELHGRPVNVARVVERGKRAEMMLRDLMSNEMLRVVEMNDDVMAPVKLLSALRSNEIVAIQGDRVYQPFQAEAPFFGSPAAFPLGPFFLAYVSGAPIIPGVVVRQGWLRYRVIMGPVIQVPHTDNRDEDLRAALAPAVCFLEDMVRLYPDQWLNFYDFWPDAGLIEQAVASRDMAAHG